MKNSIFITGTDTGVGKTIFSASLALFLKEKGINVGYFKPVETGCDSLCEDAKKLADITGQPYEETVLYRFKNPVAPYVAESVERKKIDMDKILGKVRFLSKKYDFLIVEGAGGVSVPITKEKGKIYTYLDFAYELGLSSIVVSRAGLGTINHTFLTVSVMKSRGIDLIGIVMNSFSKNMSLSERTNPAVIEEMTGLKVIKKCFSSKNPVEECLKGMENVYRLIHTHLNSPGKLF